MPVTYRTNPRREPRAQAKTKIEAIDEHNLVASPIRITTINPTTLRFRETSPSGTQFQVTVTNGQTRSQPSPSCSNP